MTFQVLPPWLAWGLIAAAAAVAAALFAIRPRPIAAQVARDDLAHGRLVVDHQDLRRHRHSLAPAQPPFNLDHRSFQIVRGPGRACQGARRVMRQALVSSRR
jgi:hypothetical protein